MGVAASAAGLLFLVLFTSVEGTGVAWTLGSSGEGEIAWSTWTQIMVFLSVAVLPACTLALATWRTPTGVRALAWASGLYCGVSVAIALVSEQVMPGAGLFVEVRRALSALLLDEPFLLLWVGRILPALLMVSVLLILWLNLVYSRWFTGRQGRGDDLCLWRLPAWVMTGFMVCIACVLTQVGWLQPLFPRSEPLLALACNGLVIGCALYWLQGLAVTNYYFFRLRLSPMAKCLGIGLQALFMVRPATTAIFAAAGLVDAWFDLRRLRAHDEIGIER